MLKLILPVIFPSWRFFSSIGPSPRIQFTFLLNENDESQVWQDFRPCPARVSFIQGLRRLFWNPEWNETLYINTCAERLFDEYSLSCEQEIMRRILVTVSRENIFHAENDIYLQYRLCAVVREGSEITQPVVFMSKPAALLSKSANFLGDT